MVENINPKGQPGKRRVIPDEVREFVIANYGRIPIKHMATQFDIPAPTLQARLPRWGIFPTRTAHRYTEEEKQYIFDHRADPIDQVALALGVTVKSLQHQYPNLGFSPKTPDQGFVTARQYARYKGVHYSTLIDHLNSGEVVGEKHGLIWQIAVDEQTQEEILENERKVKLSGLEQDGRVKKKVEKGLSDLLTPDYQDWAMSAGVGLITRLPWFNPKQAFKVSSTAALDTYEQQVSWALQQYSGQIATSSMVSNLLSLDAKNYGLIVNEEGKVVVSDQSVERIINWFSGQNEFVRLKGIGWGVGAYSKLTPATLIASNRLWREKNQYVEERHIEKDLVRRLGKSSPAARPTLEELAKHVNRDPLIEESVESFSGRPVKHLWRLRYISE